MHFTNALLLNDNNNKKHTLEFPNPTQILGGVVQ